LVIPKISSSDTSIPSVLFSIVLVELEAVLVQLIVFGCDTDWGSDFRGSVKIGDIADWPITASGELISKRFSKRIRIMNSSKPERGKS
jgi:hypothetical protein